MQSDKLNLVFRVKAPTVGHGESVHILGEGALGNWSKGDSVPLVTTPAAFPFWTTDRPIMFRAGRSVRYRYAVYRGGRFTTFENGDGDRKIEVASVAVAGADGHVIVEDELGNYVEAAEPSAAGGLSTQVIPAVPDPAEEMTRRRLYLVAYHLPVNISWTWETIDGKNLPSRRWDITWNTDNFISKTEDSVAKDHDTTWIGAITSLNIVPSPGSPDALDAGTVAGPGASAGADAATKNTTTDPATNNSSNHNIDAQELLRVMDEDDRQSLRNALKSMDCIPVFLEEDTARKGYLGFCKRVAWPVFHNLSWDLESDWDQATQGDYSVVWRSYQTINAVFAAAVCACLKENDCIWIHDYHLALLPESIRQRSPAVLQSTLKIIMFWHVPYPTSELFRTLPTRVEIVKGILHSDVVGFHSFDHARHFLTACQRLCGLSHQSNRGNLGVNVNGRNVMVSVSHVGVERKLLKGMAQSAEVASLEAQLKTKMDGKRRILIVCYEELQRLNGITLALLAFERLLEEYPRYRRRLKFVLRCTPTSSRSKDCAQALTEAQELVSRIQKNHGRAVVDFEMKTKFSIVERCSLWRACNIMIKSCVQEGLNLSPLEFVYVKSLTDMSDTPARPTALGVAPTAARAAASQILADSVLKPKFSRSTADGVVLLSEFCSSARMLNGALRINPWDISAVAKTLEQALKMTPEEGRRRRERDFAHISSQTSSAWTRRVVADAYSSSDVEIAAIDHDKSHPAGTIVSSNMMALPYKAVIQSYIQCAATNLHRVFIFDYGGTLISRESTLQSIKYDFMGITRRAPSPRIVDALQKICSDPFNHVFVVSSADKDLLERVFPLDTLPQLGLVARAGLFYSWIRRPNAEGDKMVLRSSTGTGGPTLRPSGRAVSMRTDTRSANSKRIDIEPFAPPSLVLDRNARSPSVNSNISTISSTSGDGTTYHPGSGGRIWHQPWSNAQRDDWESAALPILQNYAWRTGGSKIRRSATQLGWSYRQADPQLGKKNAVFLQHELEAVLEQYPVTVKQAHDSVNIVPRGIDKGVAVSTVMEEVQRQIGDTFPGMVFCVGDDAADEPMFSTLLESVGRHKDQKDTMQLYTCSIGKKPSQAEFYLNVAQDLEGFLIQLAACKK
jgi:trehalose 6-phosphate synthase/phosphatase